jgi:hypothetical protein
MGTIAMFDIPILFIIFNRIKPASIVFEVIREVKPKFLYISADGPRSNVDGEKDKCKQTRNKILSSIDWDCELKTFFHHENMGCKNAVYSALKWFFKENSKGIILEDDCLPSIGFFEYCKVLLDKYENDYSVRMISGRNNVGIYKDEKASYHFTTGGGIWGWATWKREIDSFDIDMKWPLEKDLYESLYHFTKDSYESKLLANEIINNSTKNDYNTWDYQWGVQGKLQNKICITPSINMIRNIGFTEEATHTTSKEGDTVHFDSEFRIKTYKHPEKKIDYNLSKMLAGTADRGLIIHLKNRIKRGIALIKNGIQNE